MRQKMVHSRMSERLKETIEEKIVTGQYLPGMRLDETELANEFSVSRTPVREALIQLAFYGLVDMRPRRGAIVAEISPQRLFEMFEVMSELEAMCGRLAARRLTDVGKDKILTAYKACQEAFEQGDSDHYYHENERFHRAFYAASQNSFLEESATALHRRLGVYRRLQLRVRGRFRDSNSEHDEIVKALLAGDGDTTADLLRKHVIIQGERFADLIASMSSIGLSVHAG